MNCAANRKFLDAYMDGELEAGKMFEMETHLQACADCDALLTVKRRMGTSLRQLAASPAPAHLRAAVMSTRRTLRWRRTIVAASLAAAALLVVGIAAGPFASAPTEDLAAVVDDVVDRHVRELPMELQHSADDAAASWFQGKIDFPVRPLSPGLRNVSFQGARVSNVREHQAAQMIYQVDGRKVTFMVFPSEHLRISGGDVRTVDGRDYLTGRRNGYNVALTRDGDMVYALSSELPADRLVALLRALR